MHQSALSGVKPLGATVHPDQLLSEEINGSLWHGVDERKQLPTLLIGRGRRHSSSVSSSGESKTYSTAGSSPSKPSLRSSRRSLRGRTGTAGRSATGCRRGWIERRPRQARRPYLDRRRWRVVRGHQAREGLKRRRSVSSV